MKKKILSILLALVMVLAIAPVSVFAEDETIFLGDVNGDGCTSVSDARMIMRFSAGLENAEATEQRLAADFNKDGKINIADARTVLRYAILLDTTNYNAAPTVTPTVSKPEQSVSEECYYVGEEYTVTITCSDIAGLIYASMFFAYDTEYFDLVDINVSNESDLRACGEYADGKISLGFAFTNQFLNNDIEIAKIKFKVIKNGCSSFVNYNITEWGGTEELRSPHITVEKTSHNHNYEAVVTAPTCGEQGYTTYTCLICGYSYIANYIPATEEHSYNNIVVTEPTHSANGYTTYTCDCGGYYIDDYVSIHTFNDDLYCDDCGKYALKYEIYDDEAYISGCDLALTGSIIIPGAIEGYPVSIGLCAFDLGKQGIDSNYTDVVISDGVKTIYEYAFAENTNLKSITIPGSVTHIGVCAFIGCESLTSVTLNNGIELINVGAFADCISLRNIIIPDSVKYIENYAFGYYYDENTGKTLLLDDFVIHGVPGSAAETYANENGITFVAITSEDDEPVTDAPAQDTSTVLSPNADSNITVTDTVASVTAGNSVEDVVKSVDNENVQILDKDGKKIIKDALVGTGSKINILDEDGKILSTYEVMVKADVDGNGKITTADARLTLRASVGLDTIEGVYATAANYDGKETISTSDARMILRKAVGLE